MGFCGCSLYFSTVTAAILGILQSVLYLCLCVIVCIDHFSSVSFLNSGNLQRAWTNRYYEISDLFRIQAAIKVMIVPTILFNLTWFFSSIFLLSANGKSKNNSNGVLQWVIITALMTTYEMLCTFQFLIIAIDSIDSVEYRKYFYLDLATLSKGYGLIFGWSFNIPMAVFTYRRYKEIRIIGKINIESVELSNLHPDTQMFENQPMYPRPYPFDPTLTGTILHQ